ncbi:MAG: (R)-benzylsuccinyl-CoA dehydrogenase [Desulfotomaculum sp. 46_296]|nr:MAG: (R)-benzylsuccinyl-CoA dehydrogenase [Desulfotomaculum sp. 46_296]HAU30752.1 benzylsuccinyl-CoA dehydrogenase [Desulfotomaculum sp.]
MDFTIPEEFVMLKKMVRKFTENEIMPLEMTVIEREADRGFEAISSIPPEEEKKILAKAKDLGLWGIDVPEEHGGQGLGMLAKMLVEEEMSRSICWIFLPPDSPNLDFLASSCKPHQYDDYLLPYSRGEKTSALALTEANAGSDAAGIQLRADRKGDKWVLNGTKLWISFGPKADFFIVIAVTDKVKKQRGGFTAFLVDKGTPGFTILRNIPCIGDMLVYELLLEDVVLDDSKVLGEVGQAFVPLQNRLGVRRIELAAKCCGAATRCMELMLTQARVRETFGSPIGDRQFVQGMIADSTAEIHATRLMVYHAASKYDSGEKDLRVEGAMTKVYGTEMLQRVSDKAIQMHGALGLSKEMVLEYIYRMCRVWRIVEGPSEIHRWLTARQIIRSEKPYETILGML